MRKISISLMAVLVSILLVLVFALSSCQPQAEKEAEEVVEEVAEKEAEEVVEEVEGKKLYKVALSNSFMGNDFRQEMEKVAEIVANREPFKSQVTLDIVNCENTPEAQSDSIDALIKQGYDAILIDASSPSALNPVVERAITAGIVVVAFDQIVTAEDAWKIEADTDKVARIQAEYLAKVIDGKGDIVLDRGLPGAPVSKVLQDGAEEVFAQYTDINVVAYFDGQYAQGPALEGMNSVLASNPKVDAVFTQGYTGPVIQALQDANHPMVPMSGFPYNGDLLELLDNNVTAIISNINFPNGAVALKMAVDILNGNDVPKYTLVEPMFLATDTTFDVGVELIKIEEGVNCWRDMSYGFTWPMLPEDFPVQVSAEEVASK